MGGYGTCVYGRTAYKGSGSSIETTPRPNNMTNEYGRCLRYAVLPSQGQGWSEYSNDDAWIWPEPQSDSERIMDNNGQPIFIVYDELTGKPYRVGMRDGPSGSGLTEPFTDKKSSTADGTEIPASLEFGEKVGPGLTEHVESHFNLRPMDENNRDTTDHTSTGFRDDFEVTAKVFKDGALTFEAESKKIPIGGDIVMPKVVQGERLKVGLDTTTSEFRLTRQDTDFLDKSRSDFESLSQQDYESILAEPVLWLSHYLNPKRNLALGVDFTGDYSSLATGPDADTESAHVFAGEGLTSTVAGLTGNMTYGFFLYQGATFPLQVISSNGVLISVTFAGVTYTVRFADGTSTVTQDLAWDGTGWVHIAVKRSGNTIIVAENAVSFTAAAIAGAVDMSGTVIIMDAQTGRIADVRAYDSVVSDEALEYLYNDITVGDGGRVLPRW